MMVVDYRVAVARAVAAARAVAVARGSRSRAG
ncbi:hypothetical protein FHU30_007737 [Actinomadura rupiterrae]|nr:hypothetical protein [Actinomadura rupiterrae]